VIVSDLESRLTSLENHQSSFALKTDFENLRGVSATTKTELESLVATVAMKAEFSSLKTAAATKTELDSVRTSVTAMKTEFEELRSTSFSKLELNSMKPLWAAKSDLDLMKLESATKTELSAVRNILDALVADVDRMKRRARQWFTIKKNGSLDGIIASLTRRYGGNVHNQGIVTISASSLLGKDHQGRNAADLNSDSLFCSRNKSDSWLCYDFKDRRVILTRYSMRSAFRPFPKSWVIEGSLNGTSWMQLDKQMNTKDLIGQNRVVSFPVSTVAESRFIKLSMTGNDHSGDSFFCLSAVEFFGTLIE
jgi:hypothetical protein